ncbi:MAG TPA: riboflavin synthase [Casimicrobiaceae bacterium]|nr:riboflavin synthase [Casimicrobiaceae bacterium]
MFTGIVQSVGRIASVVPRGDGVRIDIDVRDWATGDIAVGDSVCVNGCCLTVVDCQGATLAFDVSAETLRCTAGLDATGEVNLEKSLKLSDRLGGHLVLGHVDGVATVMRLQPVTDDAHGSFTLEIEVPQALARFIAGKGSVAVHGVSLTVNEVAGRRFSVNLIPHTLAATNLRQLPAGGRVNIEVDVVARYVARLREFEGQGDEREDAR